jgi:hypothetical protein
VRRAPVIPEEDQVLSAGQARYDASSDLFHIVVGWVLRGQFIRALGIRVTKTVAAWFFLATVTLSRDHFERPVDGVI